MRVPVVDIEVRRAGSSAIADIHVKLTGRRQDRSESEPSREINGPRATLAPGHWEFQAHAPAGMYVESITNIRGAPRRPWKAERVSDWYEVFIEPRYPSRIRITVSDKAGQIAGRVMTDGQAVPGAPVFLWRWAGAARRSPSGSVQRLGGSQS